MITKEEFIDWRNCNTHTEFQAEFMEAVLRATEEIVTRHSTNVDRDQFLKGYLNGIQACMDWQPEYIEDNRSLDEQEEA